MHSETNDNLQRIQSAGYELLDQVDRLCKKHGINYYLHAGTLLGAVRHNGFIPWDDDVDVAFFRDDYLKFISVADELPDKYQFENAYREDYFWDPVSRIVYSDSKLGEYSKEKEEYYKGYRNKVVLDLFAMDSAAPTKFGFGVQLFMLKFMYMLLIGHRYKCEREKRTGIAGFLISIMVHIGHLIPRKVLFNLYLKVSMAYNNKDTDYVFVSNDIPGKWNIKYKKDWLKKGDLSGKFGQIDVDIPLGYSDILTVQYGDYMQLPPEKDRVASHTGGTGEVWNLNAESTE